MLRKIIAVFMALMGAVYFAQGTGLFTAFPSMMNNDIRWAAVGVVVVTAAIIIWPREKRSK